MRKDASTLGNECRFRELAGLGSVQILQPRHQAWLVALQLRFHQLLL